MLHREDIVKSKHPMCFEVLLVCCALILLAGCNGSKKRPAVQTPVPPSLEEIEDRVEIARSFKTPRLPSPVVLPPAPVAFLASDRELILRGEAITLTWHTQNATTVRIDPIGPVEANGVLTVTPSDSTKYHLIAKGPGGVDVWTVWVTVTTPSPPPVQLPRSSEMDEGITVLPFQPIFFDYDQYAIRPDQQQALEDNTQLLLQHPGLRVVIEGYCDDRGSSEYNRTLGQKRAQSVKLALVQAGVRPDRIETTSFGKQNPVCAEPTEECSQRNRRVQIVQDKSNPWK